MKSVLVISSILFFLHAEAFERDSVRAEQRKEGLFVVHEVEEKETIYSIATRYGGTVDGVIKHNEIIDNKIDIGQLLYVLVEREDSSNKTESTVAKQNHSFHVVSVGETLYSLSKKYEVKITDLKKWNGLESNDLSLGMQLQVSEEITSTAEEPMEEVTNVSDTAQNTSLPADPYADFEKYLVQTGETLSTIAEKLEVQMDSLKEWNNLIGDYLKIGQELFYKQEKEIGDVNLFEPKKPSRTQIDEKGFEKSFEEGVASVIESMDTKRYLALHRTLPIGTNLEVRNLMNNQVVHVKVVGRLPNTGLNKNLLLRLSQPAYDQLGILDSKSRVEVSYYKQ